MDNNNMQNNETQQNEFQQSAPQQNTEFQQNTYQQSAPQQAYNPQQFVDDPRKSKVAAGLLGIFLGCFGVHNFYLGFTTKAVIQLVCTIVGYVLGFLGSFILIGAVLFLVPIGMWIWGLIEGIMILAGSIKTDAKGIPLKD